MRDSTSTPTEVPKRPSIQDVVIVDFETAADAKYSLKKMSTRAYIENSRFDILCVAIAEGNGNVDFYHKLDTGERTLGHARQRLERLAREGKWLASHNVAFDGMILGLKWGVTFSHTFDTASYLRHLDLWASLHNGALYLGHEKGTAPAFDESSLKSPVTLREMAKYNARDVALCRRIFVAALANEAFPDLEIWVIDKTGRDNLRGIRLDAERAAELAVIYDGKSQAALERFCKTYTDFSTGDLNRTEVIKAYVERRFGVVLAGLDKKDPALLEARNANESLREFLSLREAIVFWRKLADRARVVAGQTNRLYGMLLYSGAHTGRFAAGGRDAERFNIQNLPSGAGRQFPEAERLREILVPDEGEAWVASDLSAIEARITAFLAQEEDLIARFSADEDVYVWFGCQVFPDKVILQDGENNHLRKMAKEAILGLGFGMGWGKFFERLRAADPGIEEATARRLFDKYNEVFPRIRALRKRLWASFVTAAKNNVVTTEGLCEFRPFDDPSGKGVMVVLPTGRALHYRSIRTTEKIWDDGGVTDQYWYGEGYSFDVGQNVGSQRSPKRMMKFDDGRVRISIYAQVLVENVVQAVARDLLVGQMFVLEEVEGLRVAFHVHDEIVAATPACRCGDPDHHDETCAWARGREAVKRVMSAVPPFFPRLEGLPLSCKVSGRIRERYGK